MSNVPSDLRYSKDHEWARKEGDLVVIGITDHAQSELGDIVFVDLPHVGDSVTQGDSMGTIEAVKTVAEVYAPVSGEIVEVNSVLGDKAAVINEDAYGAGWIAKVRPSAPAELDALLDAGAYSALLGN